MRLATVKSISEATRRNILDWLSVERVPWSGRLAEPEFLARLWDLSTLPSTDPRFRDAAGDIWQHRINNWDWDEDWVFHDSRFNLLHCPDEQFGKFLCEMLHPVIRHDPDEVRRLAAAFNEHLAADGWELAETRLLSERPVFSARRREGFHTAATSLGVDRYERLEDPEALREHLRRIDHNLTSDPAGAIGSAKELVESVCKTLLDDYQVTYRPGADLMELYKAVQKALRLNAEVVEGSGKGSEAAVRALRALVTTIQALAELRNELGLGHGRSRRSVALTRHARLAFNASVAVSEFLLDTWHTRRAADAKTPPGVERPRQAAS